MLVLVLNCGSSSIRIAAVNSLSGERRYELHVERLGGRAPAIVRHSESDVEVECDSDHGLALRLALQQSVSALQSEHIDCVGHRVVHGGDEFRGATLIDDKVERSIEARPFAR